MSAPDNLRILYVWDADYPWDVRVQKICAALTEAGHEVHIAARNRGRRPALERGPEATIHRLPILRALPRTLDALSSFPAFFNPRWLRHLHRLSERIRPHLIIVRDLPLAPTAVRAGARAGVPVMFDMAENYPAMIQDIWLSRRQKPWDILVRNPRLVALIEQWVVPRVDHTLVVVQESADRLLRRYGVEEARMTIVSNTPPADRLRPMAERCVGAGPPGVVYVGQMEIPRGVGELIEAVALLRDRGIAVHARLIGGGRDHGLFVQRAAELQLGPDILDFLGELPHGEAMRQLTHADIGVVPHHANESCNTTIPNKLFDYMAAGLAVVGSDVVPIRRILSETGAGVVFPSGSATGLADAIARLAADPDRGRFSGNGQRAIAESYSWEHDRDRLLRAVTSVCGAADSPAALALS